MFAAPTVENFSRRLESFSSTHLHPAAGQATSKTLRVGEDYRLQPTSKGFCSGLQALHHSRYSSTGPFEVLHPQGGIDKLITIGRRRYGVDQSFVDETPAHPIENLLVESVSLSSHNLKRTGQGKSSRVAWNPLWWGSWFGV